VCRTVCASASMGAGAADCSGERQAQGLVMQTNVGCGPPRRQCSTPVLRRLDGRRPPCLPTAAHAVGPVVSSRARAVRSRVRTPRSPDPKRWGVSSVGRASDFLSAGRRFDPVTPHFKPLEMKTSALRKPAGFLGLLAQCTSQCSRFSPRHSGLHTCV
jgi:hypothetical protein